MAKKIVAGNWKMNLTLNEAVELVQAIGNKIDNREVRTIVFPTTLFVNAVSDAASESIEVGVQNFSNEDAGAYTGEISVDQIRSVGGSIGLIGHSERRSYYNEDHSFLKAKVDQAISRDFEFIFCCGEPLEVREANNEMKYVREQLEKSLFHILPKQMEGGIIAYEPVWAIGTGKTASTEQAEDMHKNIRSWIAEKYNTDIANSVSILYGGSCKPSNAHELFACPNVDGGLIGGAALKAADFCSIIDSF